MILETFVPIVVLLYSFLAGVYGICDTFRGICVLPNDDPYIVDRKNNKIEPLFLRPQQSYYIRYTAQNNNPLDLSMNIFYGSVDVYIAFGREPTVTDNDLRTSSSSSNPYLSMEYTNGRSRETNILIKGGLVYSYITGVILSQSGNNPLKAGLPFTVNLRANAPMKFVGSTALKDVDMSFGATSITGGISSLSIHLSGSNLDVSDHGVGYLSVTPKAIDVNKPFTLSVKNTNASVSSILWRPEEHLDTHPVYLLNAEPTREAVNTGKSKYYYFSVPPGVMGDITIMMDVLTGDADLFVNPPSMDFYHRERSANDEPDPFSVWSSQRPTGQEKVIIKQSDSNYASTGGNYKIAVYGFNSASYVIRAFTDNAVITLLEDVPNQGSIGELGGYQYFRFLDSDPASPLLFDLQSSSGDADMYISCTLKSTGDDSGTPSRTIGHYNFSSANFNEDVVLIGANDPNSCPRGIYYIAIYASQAASFTLTAVHSGSTRMIIPGLAVSGKVFTRQYQRYQVYVGYEAEKVDIQLTPTSGDCDLYVKMDGVVDIRNYDYRSSNIGVSTDLVSIPETAVCTNCWISIMVYGFITSNYQLLVTFEDTTITLSNGLPLRESSASDKIQYFNYIATKNCDVHVVVTMLSGPEPSIFMSTNNSEPNARDNAVNRLGGSGIGAIPALTLRSVLANQDVYIGVGLANSTFTIRVSEVYNSDTVRPTLMTLLPGVPQIDSIGRTQNWVYFALPMQPGHEKITFRSVSIVGNVDLYAISCVANSTSQCTVMPNTTNYLVSTEDMEQDILTIHRADTSKVIYLVGVYGMSYYSVFQLSYTIEHSLLELQAGVPISDHVDAGETDYFGFFFSSDISALTITLTPLAGDPDLFVSTDYDHPSRDNSTWKSIRFGADSITIDPATDSKACTDCMYYIAVYGYREATYSLTVTLSTTVTTLLDGAPQSGTVNLYKWRFYSFHNSYLGNRDLNIALTSTVGDADLYVTVDGTLPSWHNYAYKSSTWLSSDLIQIHHTDSKYAPCLELGDNNDDLIPVDNSNTGCNVIIGVYGFSYAEYSLSLTSNYSTLSLQLGTPVQSSVAQGQDALFVVHPSQRRYDPESQRNSAYTLRLSVTPFSGHVNMYVSCLTQHPTASYNTHLWKLAPAEADTALDINSLSLADKGCAPYANNFYISVFGLSAATFSITAKVLNNETVSQLVQGMSVTNSVKYNAFDYYYLRINAENSNNNFQFLTTTLQGDVDLYLSSSWERRPVLDAVTGSVTSYEIQSASMGDEDITVDHDDIQDLCDKQSDATASNCYIIVAVFGRYSGGTSSYSLLAKAKDSAVLLVNGIPQPGRVKTGHYEYYTFKLAQTGYDLALSISASYGDPDIFIGMGALTHPTRYNFTFAQTMLGSDAITLQYHDMRKHCQPEPRTGKVCDVHIAVYGWKNSSYNLLGSVDDGFLSPVLLVDQQPSNGYVSAKTYKYFKYLVNVQPPAAGSSSIPTSIKFTLTPTDGGDVDLYLKFAESVDDLSSNQPGIDNNDYHSADWSSVSETITISYGMPHYCLNCVIYLAAYGYTAGSFQIQASSSNLLALHSGESLGGQVRVNEYNYYSFYNHDSFAEMTITVTAISGDADIYINKHTKEDRGEVNFPTKTNAIWRSVQYGTDSFKLSYSDSNFCADCEYIIGVFGFNNCSYTILVTNSRAAIVRLTPDRPQSGELSGATGDDQQYFSSYLTNDNADLTISLTALNTGDADIYAQLYNASDSSKLNAVDYKLPRAEDPQSYLYTTYRSRDNHIYIPSSVFAANNFYSVVILVKARSLLRYTLTAKTTARASYLLSGVPQNHFVSAGNNELFKFIPPTTDGDVRVTVTARSGDPDLFISNMNSNPHCEHGDRAWQIQCFNYTWSSRQFYTDQIIISRDDPCTAMLPTTYVHPSCTDQYNSNFNFNSARSLGNVFYINIYGYSSSQFTVLAAVVNQHVRLLAGQPVLSSTSRQVICSERSESTGVCLDRAKVKKTVQASYFSFQVSSTSTGSRRLAAQSSADELQELRASQYNVLITVVPIIMNNSSSARAALDVADVSEEVDCDGPGSDRKYDCDPLVIYINSCALSKCTELHRKPSELSLQHQLKLPVTDKQSGVTLLINSNSKRSPDGTDGSDGFCNPELHGHEDCIYYISVAHGKLTSASYQFSISARTPGDIALVACDNSHYPDGIKLRSVETISNSVAANNQLYYEICGQTQSSTGQLQRQLQVAEWMDMDNIFYSEKHLTGTSAEITIIELEQCVGQTTLFACADSSSGGGSGGGSAAGKCRELLPTTNNYEYFADASKTCQHQFTGNYDKCTSNTDSGRPVAHLELPAINGNYYLLANGTGKYQLQVQHSIKQLNAAPKVVLAGLNNQQARDIQVLATTGNTLTLQWRQARVVLAGVTNPLRADNMQYFAYVFESGKLNALLSRLSVNLHALCGIDFLSSQLKPVKVYSLSSPAGAGQADDLMQHSFTKLSPGTKYSFLLVAQCDGSCLRQLSKTAGSLRAIISCANNAAADCRAQSLVYARVEASTGSKPDKKHGEDDDGESGGDGGRDDDGQSGGGSWVGGFVTSSFVLLALLVVALVGVGVYYYRRNKEYYDSNFNFQYVNIFGGGGGSGGGAGSQSGHGSSSHAFNFDGSEHQESSASGYYNPPTVGGAGVLDFRHTASNAKEKIAHWANSVQSKAKQFVHNLSTTAGAAGQSVSGAGAGIVSSRNGFEAVRDDESASAGKVSWLTPASQLSNQTNNKFINKAASNTTYHPIHGQTGGNRPIFSVQDEEDDDDINVNL